jgi:hypothetical protein
MKIKHGSIEHPGLVVFGRPEETLFPGKKNRCIQQYCAGFVFSFYSWSQITRQ